MAVSPDGSTIVYETIADGQPRVYVRRADRLEGELLPGVENASSLFFSPDGQWVGFSGGLDQSLKKIQVTGGAAISLCPLPSGSRGASWGPDDTIIYFSKKKQNSNARTLNRAVAESHIEVIYTAEKTANRIEKVLSRRLSPRLETTYADPNRRK